MKKICGSKIGIVDPSAAGEPPDEWPPACRRTARRKSDFDPLRLTIDNEASAPRTVVAMSAQDRAQVRSLDLGDASLIYTDRWEHGFSKGVSIAVGKMTVSLVAAGRNENTIPCSEAQLVKLAEQILGRLPR